MSCKTNKLGSFVTGLIRWLSRVWRRCHSPEEEVVGSGHESLRSSAEERTEIPILPEGPPSHPVGQVLAYKGRPQIAVVDLGRDISRALRASWDRGRPLASGGVIDSVWLQPVFASGSTAASSLLAGNVFLATANPETLMGIGQGVSTAVMQGGRIIKHAPFIAASNAILPVVAPLMLFTTVSSVITGARLDRIQRELGALSKVLARVRKVMEAETYGKFQSAATQLDEIWSQFEHSQRFTDAMKVELVGARRDMKLLYCQFGHLVRQEIGSEEDARMVASDINLYFLSGLLDIRADLLRLYLTLQDDPGFAGRRDAALAEKVKQYKQHLQDLLREDPIARFCQERESSKVPFHDLRKRLPKRLGGGLPARIRNAQAIRKAFRPIHERIVRWTDGFDSETGTALEQSAIVVYRDQDGRALHARHTQDFRLQLSAQADRPPPGPPTSM